MSVKQIVVRVLASGVSAHVPITSGTTAADALEAVGVSGDAQHDYVLTSAKGDRLYQPRDTLDASVEEGQVFDAQPWIDVGATDPEVARLVVGVGLVLVVAAAAMVLVWASGGSKSKTRSSSAKKGGDALLQLLGWQRSGDWYTGSYAVAGRRLPGKVFFRSRWRCDFRVWAPSRLIEACGEQQGCFIPKSKPKRRGWRWFSVHLQNRPHCASSGVLAIQRLLTRAAKRTWRT